MAVEYGRLENIHYLLKRRASVSEAIERCPRAIKVAENAVSSFEAAVEEAKLNWQSCKKSSDSKQLTMNQREARIKDLQGRRNGCSSNKEFQLLNDQIAADEQANSVLADEILEMLERADELNAKVVIAMSNLEAGQKELARIQSEAHDKQQRLERDLGEVQALIAAEEKELPSDFLVEYRRRVQANQEEALARTDGQTCGNCHQMLNVQMLSELYQMLAINCKGCGAILYMSAEGLANRQH